MNDERHAQWLGYIVQLAGLMRLRDWDILLYRDGPAGDDAIASCFCTYGRKQAVIRLSNDFFGRDADEQRYVIVHELLHCHFEEQAECVRLYINNNGDRDGLFPQIFMREEELLVDGVAAVLAPFLPLPLEVPE